MSDAIAAQTAGSETKSTSAALVLLLACRFIVTLDLSIINLALPSMQADFGMTTQAMQWVLSIYALGFGGFLLFAGRAGDLFGGRRMLIIGLSLFLVSSVAGGIAPSGLWFITARAFQGLGAALIAPNAFSLTATLYSDPDKRNKAFGISAAISGIAVTVGGIVGGLLVAGPGWRWVMFINIPVSILCLIFAPLLLNSRRNVPEGQKLDVWGAVTVTLGLVGLVFVIGEGRNRGWLSAEVLTIAAAAVLLLVLFVLIERRARFPVLRLSVFRERSVLGGNLAMMIGFPGFVCCMFALSYYLQQGLGLSPVTSGLALVPMSLTFLVAATMAPRLVKRAGPRLLILCGSLAMTAGYVFLCFMGDGSRFLPQFLLGTVLIGGYGFAVPMFFIVATTALARSEQGMASGLLNTSQQLGSGVGIALMTTIVAAASGTGASSQTINQSVLNSSRYSFLICAVFLVLSTLAVVFLIPPKERKVA